MDSTAAPQLPPNAFEDKRATVIGVVVFCLLFATTMVGLRVWTRKKIINQLGWDDYACVAGLITTWASGISIAHMTEYGLGRHIYVMNPANIPLYLRDFYFSIVFYCAALLFIKLAFLFQYYRVLAVQHMRNVYIAAIVIVGGWALSQLLVGIFICTPVHGFWDSTAGAKCIPNIPQWYINAAGNIITDVAVFALPLPAIWKLNLVKGQKIILLGIFCLGFFTVIISIIRIKYLKLFEDFPWENVTSSLWSVGELTSAITCACLPTLRPFVAHYFPGLKSIIGRTTNKASIGGQSGEGYIRSRRKDAESGHQLSEAKRNLSTDGSQVELASSDRSPNTAAHPYQANYNRQTSDDAASLASNTSDLGLSARQPGVGVRTSIRPAQPEQVYEKSSYHGVQVSRELHQVSSPR
ncbi:hypothetical protein OQA88_805 [Cercophora sp. LCS_1]